jgi:hypothetical protein
VAHHKTGQWLMMADNADDGDIFFGLPSRHFQDPKDRHLSRFVPRNPKGSIPLHYKKQKVVLRLSGCGEVTSVPHMSSTEAEALAKDRLSGVVLKENNMQKRLGLLEYPPLTIV